MTQELYLIDPELTHAKLHIQLMVSHLLKHDLEMLFMFFCTLRVHKDAVNEHHNKLVRLFHEEFMSVVGQNPPTGVDRQQESQEAQSLYPSTLQLARALRLKFVGCAT
jgi:hypothetical protein